MDAWIGKCMEGCMEEGTNGSHPRGDAREVFPGNGEFEGVFEVLQGDLLACVVWCGVVWCGVVWCGVVWCSVVWCGVVWCGVV